MSSLWRMGSEFHAWMKPIVESNGCVTKSWRGKGAIARSSACTHHRQQIQITSTITSAVQLQLILQISQPAIESRELQCVCVYCALRTVHCSGSLSV